jgi:hypothetical protein
MATDVRNPVATALQELWTEKTEWKGKWTSAIFYLKIETVTRESAGGALCPFEQKILKAVILTYVNSGSFPQGCGSAFI